MYHMCDILSRKRAFQANIYNINRQISLDLVSNVHRAKELGKFDETRFIGLLTTDPLALLVLEATLFAAVWSEAALTYTTCLCLRTRTLSGKKMPTVCDWLPRSCCGMCRTPRAR